MTENRLQLIRDIVANAVDVPPPASDVSQDDALSPGDEPPPEVDGDLKDMPPSADRFDVDEMNRKFALVLVGQKAVIVLEQPEAEFHNRVRFILIESLRAWYLNKYTIIRDKDGKEKSVTWATAWLQNRNRRQFLGLEFKPDPGDIEPTPGYLNLWQGFSVAPDPKAGSYAVFRDHLLTNVCKGDEERFKWVFGWFAHLYQRPRERIATAIACRGVQGAGKTKIGEVFGSLIEAHYFLVDDPRYLTGQFNAHMSSCLLLQADEGFWAGDKVAEGRLKGLISSSFQMIENKGVDPIRIKNFVRLLVTSNEDWVVPAGKRERRWCILDIDPSCANNHDYFAEMDEELENGGRAALLADLLAFDLSTVDLRTVPKTTALLEQKLRSLDAIESWWFQRLYDGSPLRKESEWLELVLISALFDDYIEISDKVGVKRKAEESTFGNKMKDLVPGICRKRRAVDISSVQVRRLWHYVLPDLQTCRDAFVKAIGQEVDWPPIEA